MMKILFYFLSVGRDVSADKEDLEPCPAERGEGWEKNQR
jgi:hypothetical protein